MRVYAATSGRCLFRDDSVDEETEVQRARAEFFDGVQLTIDSDARQIRGLVTVTRRAPEALLFIDEIDSSEPLKQFYETVVNVCDQRDAWNLQFNTPETKAIAQLLDTEETELSAHASKELITQINDDDSAQLSFQTVPNAIKTIAATFSNFEEPLNEFGLIVVATERGPVTRQADLSCIVETDQETQNSPRLMGDTDYKRLFFRRVKDLVRRDSSQ